MTSRREAGLSSSGVQRLGCELGDVSCARSVGVLAEYQVVRENYPRPSRVEYERARPVPDNLPPVFLFIINIVSFYNVNAMPIYFTCSCVTGRGHMPCRCHVDIGVSPRVMIGYSLKGVAMLAHAGRVEGLIPKGVRQLEFDSD